jgi:uncharacterized damage-inducible protein DinB/predicted RNase H-like HicB family nuclease
LDVQGLNKMHVRLAVEDMEPNHGIAWALDLPACYSSATTAAEAIALAPQKITEYFSWLLTHNNIFPAVKEEVDVDIVETFHSFASSEDPEYIVNAFFDDDRHALGYWDVITGLTLLCWTRQDLLSTIQPIPQEQLTRTIPGEVRGSVSGILNHIAIAENWYFSHLDRGLQQGQLPGDPLDKLAVVRENTIKQLPGLIGDKRITHNYDELWSPRKVVRRTLWHERDHTQHISRLLTLL